MNRSTTILHVALAKNRMDEPVETPEEKENRLEAMRRWRRENKDKVSAYNKNRADKEKKRQEKRTEKCMESTMTPDDLKLLWERQRGCCVYCGVPVLARFVVSDSRGFDHVVPLARGGKHEVSNLVVCCGPCNNKRNANGGIPETNILEPDEDNEEL